MTPAVVHCRRSGHKSCVTYPCSRPVRSLSAMSGLAEAVNQASRRVNLQRLVVGVALEARKLTKVVIIVIARAVVLREGHSVVVARRRDLGEPMDDDAVRFTVDLDDGEDDDGKELELIVDGERVESKRIDSQTVEVSAPPNRNQYVLLIRDRGWEFPDPSTLTEGRVQVTQLARLDADRVWELRSAPLAGPPGQAEIISFRPTAQPYQGVLKTGDVEDRPERVGFIPSTDVPVSRVLERTTFRYFDVDASTLLRGSGWIPGVAVDYEVAREPVGWALDDWIESQVLGPWEDRVEAGSSVDTSAAQTQIQGISDSGIQTQADQGTSDAQETLLSLMRAETAGRAFQAGTSGSAKATTSTTWTNPVKTLVEALTGAVQMGASWSSGRSASEQQDSIRRTVTEQFQRGLSFQRESLGSADARATSSVHDSRSLRALRNTTSQTLSLSTFSIVKNWRVATLVSACTPVVYIPIDRVHAEFDAKEIFLNIRALDFALLDENLRETLRLVADRYRPGIQRVVSLFPADDLPGSRQEVRRIRGEVNLSDPGEGEGSSIKISIALSEGEEEHTYDWVLPSGQVGPLPPFRIEVNRRLTAYNGTTLIFRNPPPVKDSFVTIEKLKLTVEYADESTKVIQEARKIRLSAAESRAIPALVDLGAPGSSLPEGLLEVQEQRLLAHLNHYRTFYRLAIDLQQDSVTRFERLRERLKTEMPTTDEHVLEKVHPISFDPLGVVGGYLAFATAPHNVGEEAARKQGVGGPPSYFYASTPSPGVFGEVVQGAVRTGEANEKFAPQIPTAAADGTPAAYPWPDRVAPSTGTINSLLTNLEGPMEAGRGSPAAGGELTPKDDVAASAAKKKTEEEKAADGARPSGEEEGAPTAEGKEPGGPPAAPAGGSTQPTSTGGGAAQGS